MSGEFPSNPDQMPNRPRLSPVAKRALEILCAGAAFASGYAISSSDNHGPVAPKSAPEAVTQPTKKPIKLKPTIAPSKGRSHQFNSRHHRTHPITPQFKLKKPLSPHGGEWNIAAAVALNAGNDGHAHYLRDDRRAAGIKNPYIRALAQRAVQTAEADAIVFYNQGGDLGQEYPPQLSELSIRSLRSRTEAALQEDLTATIAYFAANNDPNEAQLDVNQISSPALIAQAKLAIQQAEAGHTDEANFTWGRIENTATKDLANLNSATTNEAMILYRHTDAYWQKYEQAPTH